MSLTDPSPSKRPCPPEVAERLKAEAIARLRASRPAWRNAHSDRLHREREAKRVRRDYQRAQARAAYEALPKKVCAGCKEELPLSAFSTKGAGKFNSRCRPCHSAKVAAHKRAKRAALTPKQLEEKRAAERAEYYARTGRKGETGRSLAERAAALAQRLAERRADAAATDEERAAKAAAKAAERAEAAARYLSKRAAKAAAKAAAREAKALAREQAKAEAHAKTVAAMRADPKQFVGSAWDWLASAGRLNQLWMEAGPRQCVGCNANVPPSAMRPPCPGNFHAGLCNECAAASYEANRRAAGLPPSEGPPRLLLKDGSTITVADLACRHAEREKGRRFRRFDRNWR